MQRWRFLGFLMPPSDGTLMISAGKKAFYAIERGRKGRLLSRSNYDMLRRNQHGRYELSRSVSCLPFLKCEEWSVLHAACPAWRVLHGVYSSATSGIIGIVQLAVQISFFLARRHILKGPTSCDDVESVERYGLHPQYFFRIGTNSM